MKDELNSAEERLRHKENDLAALQKRNQVGPSLYSCAGSKYNWVVRFEIRIRDGQSCTVPYSRKELRIRGVHSESGFFHPGSWNKGQKDTGSRKRIRNTDLTKNVFLTQKIFLSYRKYDPVCLALISDPVVFHPGSRGKKSTGSRIRIRSTAYSLITRFKNWSLLFELVPSASKMYNK